MPPYYDSLLAKLIVHGKSREESADETNRALDNFHVEGIDTLIPFLKVVIADDDYRSGNVNTRWWAQISLVRLTGKNFGSDWQAWGKWWNDSGAQPPWNPEIIRWWNGQPEPDKLAGQLAESDKKFLEQIR